MEPLIRSESTVNLTHTVMDGSKGSSGHEKSECDTIVLHTRRRNYPIKADNFTRHSRAIQQMMPNMPRMIDLTCYNVESVRTLADFLCDVDVRNFRLSGSMLLDLLQLCRIFDIARLKEFLSVYIIENIDLGRDSPSAFVFNVTMVMSDWTLMCDDRVRQRLFATSAVLFPQIQNSSYLAKFPMSLIILMLGRCELRVKSEVEVAMIALKWLQLQTFSLDDVRMIFSVVRTLFLSATERSYIDLKAAEMGFEPNIIEAINAQLNSSRNSRCCIIKDHTRNEWRRCGVLKDDKRFVQSFLPIDLRQVIPRESNQSMPVMPNVKVDEYSSFGIKSNIVAEDASSGAQTAIPSPLSPAPKKKSQKSATKTKTTRKSSGNGGNSGVAPSGGTIGGGTKSPNSGGGTDKSMMVEPPPLVAQAAAKVFFADQKSPSSSSSSGSTSSMPIGKK